MAKNKRALVGVLLLAGSLMGCTTGGYNTGNTARNAYPAPAWDGITANDTTQTTQVMDSDKSISGQRIQTCLAEARQLSRIGNGTYNNLIESLKRSITATKYYAGFAGQLSGNTQDTITPLYQYKINDTCNTISQSLLAELKKSDL